MVEAASAFFADMSSGAVASGASIRCGMTLMAPPFARRAPKFYPEPQRAEMGRVFSPSSNHRCCDIARARQNNSRL